jgi:hypothetical protein
MSRIKRRSTAVLSRRSVTASGHEFKRGNRPAQGKFTFIVKGFSQAAGLCRCNFGWLIGLQARNLSPARPHSGLMGLA